MVTEENLLKFLKKTLPNITWNTEKYGRKPYKEILIFANKKRVYSIYIKHIFSEHIKRVIKRNILYELRYRKVIKITCKLKEK